MWRTLPDIIDYNLAFFFGGITVLFRILFNSQPLSSEDEHRQRPVCVNWAKSQTQRVSQSPVPPPNQQEKPKNTTQPIILMSSKKASKTCKGRKQSTTDRVDIRNKDQQPWAHRSPAKCICRSARKTWITPNVNSSQKKKETAACTQNAVQHVAEYTHMPLSCTRRHNVPIHVPIRGLPSLRRTTPHWPKPLPVGKKRPGRKIGMSSRRPSSPCQNKTIPVERIDARRSTAPRKPQARVGLTLAASGNSQTPFARPSRCTINGSHEGHDTNVKEKRAREDATDTAGRLTPAQSHALKASRPRRGKHSRPRASTARKNRSVSRVQLCC